MPQLRVCGLFAELAYQTLKALSPRALALQPLLLLCGGCSRPSWGLCQWLASPSEWHEALDGEGAARQAGH